MKELKRRQIAYAESFGPIYLSSLGAHLLNIKNQEDPFYFVHGRPVNLRLHLLQVAPPGFGKTLFLETFCEERYGLFSGPVETKFEQYMTEAGLVGTIVEHKGTMYKRAGLAKVHDKAIIAVEEFAGIIAMIAARHSSQLDTQLLTVLDSGRVCKRLRGGKLEYLTYITLWTGTQPARFKLSSGLGRRFLFISFLPDREEEKIIREHRRRARNVPADLAALSRIRSRIEDLKHSISQIRKIELQIDDIMDRIKAPTLLEMLLEKLSIGYTAVRYPEERLVVQPSQELESIIAHAYRWFKEIMMEPDVTLVLKRLPAPTHEIISMLTQYGYTWTEIIELLQRLFRSKLIYRDCGMLRRYNRR